MLHGLGDSGDGWAPVGAEWAPDLKHVKFIFPHAPNVSCTGRRLLHPAVADWQLQVTVLHWQGQLQPAALVHRCDAYVRLGRLPLASTELACGTLHMQPMCQPGWGQHLRHQRSC